MRFTCRHCDAAAKVYSRNNISNDISELYYACQQCGHRFVVSAAYKHTVTPPTQQLTDALKCLVMQLSDKQRAEFRALLSG